VHGPLLGAFMRTMVLVLLGDGVAAKLLKKIALIFSVLPNRAYDGHSPYDASMNGLG
jgi:glycerol uptake facilitator-like aquaporin